MNDLQEFETRLRQLHPVNQKGDEALAELVRIVGGQDPSHGAGFELKSQSSAATGQHAGEPGRSKQPNVQESIISGDCAAIEAALLGGKQSQAEILPEAERSKAECKSPAPRAPFLSGDFAAIEAGLLGGLREQEQEQAMARLSEADVFPSVDLADRLLHQDEQPVSLRADAADSHIRSRRPLYALVAIVVAGIGLAVNFGLKTQDSGLTEVATVTAEAGLAAPGLQTTSGADVPAQDAAILSTPSEPPPVALINKTKQPFDLPQPEEKTPLVVALIGSQVPSDSEPAAAPAQAQTPVEPLSAAAPAVPDKVKDDLIRPDSTALPDGTPSQTDVMAPPVSPQHPPAAAKTRPAKAATRVAKSPNATAAAAAPKARGDGEPVQIAKKTKPKPASPIDAAPAAMTNAKAQASATQPSPPSTGAFGFIETAMNSVTTTAAKLLEWGGIQTGSRP
jgi:hypothetical protein